MKSFLEVQATAQVTLAKLKKAKEAFASEIADAILGRIAQRNVNSTLRTDIEKSMVGFTDAEKVDILLDAIVKVSVTTAKGNSAGISKSYNDGAPVQSSKSLDVGFLSGRKKK